MKPGDLVEYIGASSLSLLDELAYAEEYEMYKGRYGFVTSLIRWSNGDVSGALVFFPGLEKQGRATGYGRKDGLHEMLKKELKVINIR
jgi:hypothetical protein